MIHSEFRWIRKVKIRSAIDYFMNLLSNLQGHMDGKTEMVQATVELSGKFVEIRH